MRARGEGGITGREDCCDVLARWGQCRRGVLDLLRISGWLRAVGLGRLEAITSLIGPMRRHSNGCQITDWSG